MVSYTQKIYSEFRNMLDTSAEIMKRRKELEAKVNETYEKLLASQKQSDVKPPQES
jgi:hypothetical protein